MSETELIAMIESLTPEQQGDVTVVLGIFVLIMLAVLIVQIVAQWKIFTKAGRPGWHCLIPVLNMYDEFDMCWDGRLGIAISVIPIIVNMIPIDFMQGNSVFGGLLAIISLTVGVIAVIERVKLSQSFGKGILFAFGLILLQPIFMMILGFGSAKYIGKSEGTVLPTRNI